MKDNKGITRRELLIRLGQIGGAAAVLQGISVLGLTPISNAFAEAAKKGARTDILDVGSGNGKSVAVIGAGVSGITSAYELNRAGYEVTVFEASERKGGRSLTLRRGDTFQEEGREKLTCEFEAKDSHGNDIYLNAGPGRIPQQHVLVLAYCRQWNVRLEPYIFASRNNLLQADDFNKGKPMKIREMKHSLRGEISQMLAASVRKGELEKELSPKEKELLLRMLKEFGDLKSVDKYKSTKDACDALNATSEDVGKVLAFCGTNRAGYAEWPGIKEGRLKPHVKLEDILLSELWDIELFRDMRINQQASLMQPVGGMDMFWKGALEQFAGPGNPDKKTLDDLVKTNTPVTKIILNDKKDKVTVTYRDKDNKNQEFTKVFDFCISTMAPSQLNEHVENNFSGDFKTALYLSKRADTASCKVGWQTKSRFWEENDDIYGGISWTKHIIGQIWYPSNSYQANIGVLTGLYNREEDAVKIGKLSHQKRLEKAAAGGEKLHPGFKEMVDYDKGISIAWQNMKYYAGGWQTNTSTEENVKEIYEPLMEAQGHFYMSGDSMSWNDGWMEGAIQSSHYVLNKIDKQVKMKG